MMGKNVMKAMGLDMHSIKQKYPTFAALLKARMDSSYCSKVADDMGHLEDFKVFVTDCTVVT